MSDLKVISDRSTKDKTDSMWYRSSDHTPIRVVEYKGRKWVLWAMGEVDFTYKDERYYCLSNCTDITNDDELGDALDNDELDLFFNNSALNSSKYLVCTPLTEVKTSPAFIPAFSENEFLLTLST